MGTKSKQQDQPALALKDIESLLQPMPHKKVPSGDEPPMEGTHQRLPPAVAAGMAAERRLMETSS